ncbi:hypothetical protein F5X99DRAFT_205223 [Biscogniauxia marginata]|nr:hypothetical protein F5X99DRAFT_205223 [Biscogniauxia marginata]
MQTVPSLIGAGSAVAAAATGLVFGQLADGQPSPPRPSSSRHESTPGHEFLNANLHSASRPATRNSLAPPSSNDDFVQHAAHQHQHQHPPPNLNLNLTTQPRIPRRPSNIQISPPKSSSARHPLARQGDFTATTPIAEGPRDSFSSNGSWMRRLSLRPRSQHESIRSSVGPDSPSIFSFGSAAPILPPPGQARPQLPPNKLVKRASATNGADSSFLARRGSRSQGILRRPATSHQRSATLHQQIEAETAPTVPDLSVEQQRRPRAQTVGHQPPVPALGAARSESSTWKSFWHSRISRGFSRLSPLKGGDNSAAPGANRICVEQQPRRRVYLVTPKSLMMNTSLQVPDDAHRESEKRTDTEASPHASEKSQVSPESTPSKQLRRSISMHFSSPTNWISKSGSIRRRKRGDTTGGGTKRHVSAPTTADADSTQVDDHTGPDESYHSTEDGHAEPELATIFRPREDRRSSSSPIPPLSRISSFHIDRFGSSSAASNGRYDEPMISPTSPAPRVSSNASHTRTLERASTVGSSEYHPGFISGDDDDTDSKTDTPFDSFRTVASVGRRTIDSPLEFMFDESPPSTAGNNTKPKRLSIQEILGPAFDGGNKIMEEDEGLSTPVRATYEVAEVHFASTSISDEHDSRHHLTPADFDLPKDYGRLSLDEDDDLDWAREDDVEIYNHLSPPSSMNSRRGSPSLRTALGDISGNRKSDVRFDLTSERPRSTLFDWAEPPAHDKYDGDGSYSYRPKTVHGKQEMDVRGGRSASRKGPTAAHVRSQSVPIVPDQPDMAKSMAKFGTWGLSKKNVSEDWDDDFEFDEEDGLDPIAGQKEENGFSMLVPASIQATQPTVKAHSGQIRELSLLVNDLKRLCRLGREMDMLHGSSTKLWDEAEGIIALASPDEEDAPSDRSADLDPNFDDVRFIDQGFDGPLLDDFEYSRTPESQRSTAMRDRSSPRRRSVFSPEDDIFGTWDPVDEDASPDRPRTPEDHDGEVGQRSSSVTRSVMDCMQSRHAKSNGEDDNKHSNGKVNFDTNSLKELVKRASELRDGLSDLVRRADHITSSPARTARHTRSDGSPAFTRVFDSPASSPGKRIPQSQSGSSVMSGSSISASPSNGLGQRMQMMTVS